MVFTARLARVAVNVGKVGTDLSEPAVVRRGNKVALYLETSFLEENKFSLEVVCLEGFLPR